MNKVHPQVVEAHKNFVEMSRKDVSLAEFVSDTSHATYKGPWTKDGVKMSRAELSAELYGFPGLIKRVKPSLAKVYNMGVGTGSGGFVAPGLLITNHHVMHASETLQVRLPGSSKRYPAHVVGQSRDMDMSLLSTPAEGVPMTIGDSTAMDMGEQVMAIGYPAAGGVETELKSVPGTIAGRQVINGHMLLQITAPINPGNSGGPLFNRNGEFIGINSAGIPPLENVGFAIPSETVMAFLPSLVRGVVEEPWLGIKTTRLSPMLEMALYKRETNGTRVAWVVEGGIAHAAGLRRGAVVLSVDGHDIDRAGYIYRGHGPEPWDVYAEEQGPEKRPKIVYFDGDVHETVLDLSIRTRAPIDKEHAPIPSMKLGPFIVQQLSVDLTQKIPHLGSYTRYPHNTRPWVVVSAVCNVSTPTDAELMIQRGDLITRVGGVEVRTLADVKRAHKGASLIETSEGVVALVQ